MSVSVSERPTKQAESDTRRNEASFKLVGSCAARQRIASVDSSVSLTGCGSGHEKRAHSDRTTKSQSEWCESCKPNCDLREGMHCNAHHRGPSEVKVRPRHQSRWLSDMQR